VRNSWMLRPQCISTTIDTSTKLRDAIEPIVYWHSVSAGLDAHSELARSLMHLRHQDEDHEVEHKGEAGHLKQHRQATLIAPSCVASSAATNKSKAAFKSQGDCYKSNS